MVGDSLSMKSVFFFFLFTSCETFSTHQPASVVSWFSPQKVKWCTVHSVSSPLSLVALCACVYVHVAGDGLSRVEIWNRVTSSLKTNITIVSLADVAVCVCMCGCGWIQTFLLPLLAHVLLKFCHIVPLLCLRLFHTTLPLHWGLIILDIVVCYDLLMGLIFVAKHPEYHEAIWWSICLSFCRNRILQIRPFRIIDDP